MLKYSIIFCIISTVIIKLNSQPCPPQCNTCSSSTQCISCAQQYYPQVISGILQCLPCADYCLTCTNASSCVACLPPYSAPNTVSTQQCIDCLIPYSKSCSSAVSASSCISQYYISNNYCVSCLLNCKVCSSHSDCQTCISGYYLNTSILTCNPCPQNCQQCDQYTPSRCTQCSSGYQLTSIYTCTKILCDAGSVGPCLYCSASNVCRQCQYGYYWNSSTNKCTNGASVLCLGANGIYPNQCVVCEQYAVTVNTGVYSNSIENKWCKAYRNVDINGAFYRQIYYYAYNHVSNLRSLFSSNNPLTVQPVSGQSSYRVSPASILSIASLPSFYRISMFIKYRNQAFTSTPNLSLSSTTEQQTQQQTITLISSQTVPTTNKYSTTYLHSNNLQISFQTDADLYLVQILIRVTKCPSTCYRCLNEQYCEMCYAPQYVSNYQCVDNCTIYYHYVQNRSCLASCPSQFYPAIINTAKYCQPCVTPCFTCTSQSKCLSCASGYFLLPNSTCVTACLPTTYPNSINRICESCISPCRECTSPTACTSCSLGFFNSTHCVNQCPTGQYGDQTAKQCKNCQLPCTKCDKTPTRCLSCQAGKYFYDYGCSTTCVDRYYANSNTMTCQQCKPPCLTCTSVSSCLTCTYNYLYQNQCLSTCPSQHYPNITAKSCHQCPTNCLSCTSVSACTQCQPSINKCLFNGTCVDKGACDSTTQYYSVINTGYCECKQCVYPCKDCSSLTNCLSCIQGYLHQNQCRSLCPTGYYGDNTTFLCTLCSVKFTNCLQCSSKVCTRCSSGALLHNGQCLATCPQFHYQQSEKCHKCVAPCKKCTSFTSCLSCVSPYILLQTANNGNSCSIQCPSDHVALTSQLNPQNLQCSQCSIPCTSCQNSVTNCTRCSYGYYLYVGVSPQQNQCMQNCSTVLPVNTYYNEQITSQCTQCLFPCLQCKSGSQCLSCRIGYLNGFECKQCNNGMYQNNGICQQCPAQCKSCFSPQYCVSCSTGFYLYGYSCISDTSICTTNGYYVLGKVCQKCQMPCKTCQLTSTNCLSCVSGYIYYPQSQISTKCITQCPLATYRSAQLCLACDVACQSCSTSATYCFSCVSPYYLSLSTMSCISSCPANTYLQGVICQACKYPCLHCSSQSECISCMSGTLVGTKCYTTCPVGKFSNSSAMCQSCTSPCSECQVASSNCTQCINGYYLHGNQCLQQCPALYFGQTEAKQCLQCLGLCQQCNSHINCVTCSSDLIYYFNTAKNYAQCVSECPISFYRTINPYLATTRAQCTACLSDCLTCTNNTQCILCKNNKVQYLGQCYVQCPSQMYSSSGVCQQCSQPCFNCSDAFTCTACMNNSFLLVGSAECIIGETCPLGFYRITGTRLCNSRCLQFQYHQNNRTCSATGCNTNQYLGLDYFCYYQCAQNTISNQQYQCVSCATQLQCADGLFYNLKWWIKRDEIFVGVYFTQLPVYADAVSSAQIEIKGAGDIAYQIVTTQRRMLLQQQQHYESNYNGYKVGNTLAEQNLIIQLYPQSSFSDLTLTVSFINALSTYKNPIQRTQKKILISGYDKYSSELPILQQLASTFIGIFLLVCAIIGLVRNPYLTDYAQLIYVLGLINLHYPVNLAQFLESGYIAHLTRIIVSVQQADAYENGKFGYVTSMGLLYNCAFNLIIIMTGLICFFILFCVYKVLQKSLNYNKVQEEECSNPIQLQNTNQNIITKNTKDQTDVNAIESEDGSKKLACFLFLQQNFIKNFILHFLNRLIFINFLPLTIFSFAQIQILTFEQQGQNTNSIISSGLSIFVILLVVSYPIFLFIKVPTKSKYTFLLIRKLVLGIALVLSRQNAQYIIGVISVICITTAILIKSYRLQKMHFQTKLLMALQVCQFLIMIILAIFAMIGNGTMTQVRMALSWIAIGLIIIVMLVYLGFQVIRFASYIYHKKNGITLFEKWGLVDKYSDSDTNVDNSEGNSDSDTFNSQKKQQQADKNKAKTLTFQKPAIAQDTSQNAKGIQNSLPPIVNKRMPANDKNNKFFWTYNDNESNNQSDKDQERAPNMLIRCINQFSDYDPNEIRDVPSDGHRRISKVNTNKRESRSKMKDENQQQQIKQQREDQQ